MDFKETKQRALCRVNNLVVDRESRRVWVENREINLSCLEFDLLDYLMTVPGKAFSFDEILHNVWGCNSGQGGTREQVKSLVRRLRHKLGIKRDKPGYIVSVRGYGFRLRNLF
jgi:DNA-binding response OmpR family regulator